MADPVQLPQTLLYIESELPPGMTLAEYRATRAVARKPRRTLAAWFRRFRRR